MFDIGISELMVIAVVALVVIGPERLPKVARTAGALLGRAQRYVNDVKSDISRQVELDELKKMRDQVQDAAESVESSVRDFQSDIGQSLNDVQSGFQSIGSSASGRRYEDPLYDAAAPERGWAAEAHARRVRERVKDRMRQRAGKIQRPS